MYSLLYNTNSLKYYLPFALSLFLLLSACSKKEDLNTVEVEVEAEAIQELDIYIAFSKKENGLSKPYYWKNGEVFALPYEGNTSAVARDIFVYKNDVYIAGHINDNNNLSAQKPYKSVFWKNSVLEELIVPNETPLPITSAEACCIFVSNDNVYVLGATYAPLSAIILWKNSVPERISYGTIIKGSNDLYVYEDNVYFTGYNIASFISQVRFWKNKEQLSFNYTATPAHVSGIAVDSENIYLSGGTNTNNSASAAVWKNGKLMPLVINRFYSRSEALAIDSGNVYLAGSEMNKASIWKNGIKMPLDLLESAESYVTDIKVYKGSVVAIGYTDEDFTIWQNGVARKINLINDLYAAPRLFIAEKN